MSLDKKRRAGGDRAPLTAAKRKQPNQKGIPSAGLKSTRRRVSMRAGFAAAHANIVAASEKAPSMSTLALELALRQARHFMFGDEMATFVPDFALAAAACTELERRRADLLPFDSPRDGDSELRK